MEIKELQKKDFQKVIEYAISGMHFEEYLTNKLMLNIYGRYFRFLYKGIIINHNKNRANLH